MSKNTKTDSPTKQTLLNFYTQNGALPHLLGIMTQKNYTEPWGELDFIGTLNELIDEGKHIEQGNLVQIERVLFIQAQTLDTIFNNLACRASQTDFVDHIDSLLRLALKAQSQCRTTLEALANIKNPPHVAFVKQANIGHTQQVNNGVVSKMADDGSRVKKIKKQQNQLLEVSNGERLDKGTPEQAVTSNKKLAAVDKFYRA